MIATPLVKEIGKFNAIRYKESMSIKRGKAEKYLVCDLSGNVVASAVLRIGANEVSLPSGAFIVKVAQAVAKVVI